MFRLCIFIAVLRSKLEQKLVLVNVFTHRFFIQKLRIHIARSKILETTWISNLWTSTFFSSHLYTVIVIKFDFYNLLQICNLALPNLHSISNQWTFYQIEKLIYNIFSIDDIYRVNLHLLLDGNNLPYNIISTGHIDGPW